MGGCRRGMGPSEAERGERQAGSAGVEDMSAREHLSFLLNRNRRDMRFEAPASPN
jgi:hypothetical protein